jgi:hypothetical protein
VHSSGLRSGQGVSVSRKRWIATTKARDGAQDELDLERMGSQDVIVGRPESRAGTSSSDHQTSDGEPADLATTVSGHSEERRAGKDGMVLHVKELHG